MTSESARNAAIVQQLPALFATVGTGDRGGTGLPHCLRGTRALT
jgi:hypothetical protein